MLHQLAVAVVELHLGAVALGIVFIGTLLGHLAVLVEALLLDLLSADEFAAFLLGHLVAEEDGALDAVAIAVVEVGGASGEHLLAVVLVPSEAVAVDVEVVAVPSVLVGLGAELVGEVSALVEGDAVDADELTASVASAAEVVGVLNHVKRVAVDAHFGARVLAGLRACKCSACNEQDEYESNIFLHDISMFSDCKSTTFSETKR